ncbi:hypothetical protein POX_h09671 [Penicillium oxalicum]|nr:hypothetical protein POX_h09671 [Penicillium oxalicum]KAI2785908.1 hypothetical protein POX_h09671 [Penicillium oxalicum]
MMSQIDERNSFPDVTPSEGSIFMPLKTPGIQAVRRSNARALWMNLY